MANNGITILPYIDQNAYETVKTQVNTASNTQTQSFDETLSAAQKASAALTIDALVAASDSGTVNSTTVQTFFTENNINITLSSATPSTATVSADVSPASESTPTDTESTDAASTNAENTSNAETVHNTTSTNYYNSGALKCSDELEGYFKEAAKKYGVDIKLLKSIAKQESNFDPNATSKSGAMGIMQLMPFTAEELGVEQPYDAKSNIMGGAELIAKLLDKYDGDKTLALAAYNSGSGNVAKYGGVPPFKETQNYVKKVLGYYNS